MQYQRAVNIVARVDPRKVDELEHVLNANREPYGGKNALLPFDKLQNVHFARVVLLPASQQSANLWIPPTIVLAAEVDASADDTIEQLVRYGAAGIDAIFMHCEGYPRHSSISDAQRTAYLRRQSVPVQAYYVNTVGRTVNEVEENARLREEIGQYLDAQRDALTGTAIEVRRRVQEFISAQPRLAWASVPYAAKRPSRLAGLFAIALALVPVALFVALMFVFPILFIVPIALLLLLRFHEAANVEYNYRPPSANVRLCESDEDRLVQNQLSAIGYVQKGLFRRLLLRTMLWALAIAARHLYNRGQLSGVDTIHFARWVLVDSGHRLYFMSNYDGSSESYMDDFIDRVAFGLNAVFGNGQGWPATRFLFWRGAKNEQAFKAYFRSHQVPTQIWYVAPAYTGVTAINVSRDEKIRRGLWGAMTEKEAAAWLRLL
jgi:hypothetical protein